MMPGSLNPEKMQKMMKQLGLDTEEVDAEEVEIRGEENYIVKNPQVTLIDMKGKKTFQIMGDIEKREKKTYTEEDVETVVEKADCSEEEAKEALEESDGDIANAILELED